VQVRIFHHDSDEELGHEESMIRDVADVGGEGRMFKQHKEMMDVDDEEEPGQEDLWPYNEPSRKFLYLLLRQLVLICVSDGFYGGRPGRTQEKLYPLWRRRT
jgi:hypothetical protein